jgi:hypothetical protein
MRGRDWSIVLFLALGFQATAVAQDRQQTREGVWFNGGLGLGSAGCDNCDSRHESIMATLGIGGTLSPHVLLGASIDAWGKGVEGAFPFNSIVTALARVRWYTSAPGGFFLTAGAGLGAVKSGSTDIASSYESGTGALLGIGYDIRIGNNVSFTPFGNGLVAHSGGSTVNVWTIGFSVTAH